MALLRVARFGQLWGRLCLELRRQVLQARPLCFSLVRTLPHMRAIVGLRSLLLAGNSQASPWDPLRWSWCPQSPCGAGPDDSVLGL